LEAFECGHFRQDKDDGTIAEGFRVGAGSGRLDPRIGEGRAVE
jgi:hypothetical protein